MTGASRKAKPSGTSSGRTGAGGKSSASKKSGKAAPTALTPEQRELTRARQRAVRLLAAKDRSRAELEQRLVLAGFAAPVVARVLAEFARAGLLNDAKLAARMVERELDLAPAARPLLRAKLERKGLDEHDTDRAVESALRGREDLEDARRAVAARLDRMAGAARLDFRLLVGRLTGYAARRGFEAELVQQAVESVLRQRKLWKPSIDPQIDD